MKKLVRVIHKCLSFSRGIYQYSYVAYGSFKTIPNPLKQLPVINLMIPEAPSC